MRNVTSYPLHPQRRLV